MATTTPNFGWSVPTSTDLVKDGATAIETLGDSIDASLVDLKGGTSGQVLAKNSNTDMDFVWVAQDDSNAIQNAIVDAKGDLISATAADTPARLAVGANGTVLTADSAETTGLKWVAPSAAGASFTLLNAGGTALTAATTITISGISGQNQIFVWVDGASSVNASAFLRIGFNADAANHYFSQVGTLGGAAYDNASANDSSFYISRMGNSAANTMNGYLHINAANSTGLKPVWAAGGGTGSTTDVYFATGGYYSGSSAISSVKIISTDGNFDAGTVYVYGSAI